MDFLGFSTSLKELRLMRQQPAYRFLLMCFLEAMRLGLWGIAIWKADLNTVIELIEFWR